MKVMFRSALFAAGVLTTVSVLAATVPAAKSDTLKNSQDKLSYALGIETGRSFKTHDVQINPTVFSQGVTDGVQGNEPLLSDAEVQQQIDSFQQEALAKMQQQLKDSAGKNQQAETEFLATNKAKSGITTTASGLQYQVIDAGSGTPPTDNDSVTVDYEGKLLNGQVFDSSYQRGKPATFPVSAVISGWQEALKLMKPGATYELFIPSALAYGEQGAGGIIGPNEMLTFKVHLISVQPGSSSASQKTGG